MYDDELRDARANEKSGVWRIGLVGVLKSHIPGQSTTTAAATGTTLTTAAPVPVPAPKRSAIHILSVHGNRYHQVEFVILHGARTPFAHIAHQKTH